MLSIYGWIVHTVDKVLWRMLGSVDGRGAHHELFASLCNQNVRTTQFKFSGFIK